MSCKYHPLSMSSHLPAMAQEDVSTLCFPSVQMPPLDNFVSQSRVTVYTVEDYMEMSGEVLGQYAAV